MRKNTQSNLMLFSIGVCVLFSCTTKRSVKLFEIRHGVELGIDFKNTIHTSDTFNAITYEYIYNGSGVGIGDFNNDGMDDVFFGGNQASSELYINQGNLKFEKITIQAGLSTNRWITGISVVDINADGWKDIYLCVAGKASSENRRNLLFINQGLKNGIPLFKESAKSYGLDDDRYATMAAFFDYDKDGDLDMYLVNNWLEQFNRNNLRLKRIDGAAESTDRLYRNNGNNSFSDVSKEAGITIEGYGLGVAVSDLNQDSWPDIYVANDFITNDLIWINQHDGTFKDMASAYLKHQTHNGMGVDIADFNNDLLPDILEVDMLPPDNKRQKLMTPGQNYDNFYMSLKIGYTPQYMRNTLQLNRGKDEDGIMLFSEMAFLAGVAKTDWSWSPLFADFDNDGWKDIFIGSGYRKDVTNLDFIFFGLQESPFGNKESKQKEYWKDLEKLSDVKTSNHIFQNKGTLSFEDKTTEWGIEMPIYTNGAAYADFDNDGDMDIITNNIDQEIILYENKANEKKEKSHFINIASKDDYLFGQKVIAYANGKNQYQEINPYRGFQSSVTATVHFGLGQNAKIDSVVVEWPNGLFAKYDNLKADTTLVVSISDASLTRKSPVAISELSFEKLSSIKFIHKETSNSDIKNTRTLLHELTRYGPCITSGDINKDGLDDFFIGGEVGNASRLFIQKENGGFTSTRFTTDSLREDGGAHFFDADNDGDLDLYVGGACASNISEPSSHQLFLNDGNGKFSTSSFLPIVKTSASCIESADYDNDGDLDLFVGGRLKPKEYPISPRSYILRNDRGRFTDVTNQLNPTLEEPGMVSSAVWTDIDSDGKIDLAIAGEWMPIRVLKNTGLKFEEATAQLELQNTDGWWNCLKAADLNHDGYPEIIAGNTGKNSYFQPTEKEPVQIVAKDFDKNGSIDPIITYYNHVEKDRFIVHNRLVTLEQIPFLKKRFETFTQYATTPFESAFSKEELKDAYTKSAFELSSLVLVNKAGKKFEKVELPEIAQLSTINDILVEDINQDNQMDIVLIGNDFAQETLFGRYDASIGTVLLGDGKLGWQIHQSNRGRFISNKDAKFIRSLHTRKGKSFLITNNNDSIDYYRPVLR
jgi:enediyne biosynthesis protein E4